MGGFVTIDLGTLGGDLSQSTAINDAGQVTGYSGTAAAAGALRTPAAASAGYAGRSATS